MEHQSRRHRLQSSVHTPPASISSSRKYAVEDISGDEQVLPTSVTVAVVHDVPSYLEQHQVALSNDIVDGLTALVLTIHEQLETGAELSQRAPAQ